MKAEWVVILHRALSGSGLVDLRLGERRHSSTDWHGVAMAELVAEGYLHPLPEQTDDPDTISYRVTEEGRRALRDP